MGSLRVPTTPLILAKSFALSGACGKTPKNLEGGAVG
jgi:hypothetical protein